MVFHVCVLAAASHTQHPQHWTECAFLGSATSKSTNMPPPQAWNFLSSVGKVAYSEPTCPLSQQLSWHPFLCIQMEKAQRDANNGVEFIFILPSAPLIDHCLFIYSLYCMTLPCDWTPVIELPLPMEFLGEEGGEKRQRQRERERERGKGKGERG